MYFSIIARFFIETSLEIMITSILNFEDPMLLDIGDYVSLSIAVLMMGVVLTGSILLSVTIKKMNKDKGKQLNKKLGFLYKDLKTDSVL